MNEYIIRQETEKDFFEVEHLTREAFWNVNVPGCDEHYMVHCMRSHPDFLPRLALVLEKDGKIIANVMYSKATLTDEQGIKMQILTFGPFSVLPAMQRKGYGKALLEHSFTVAKELGYDCIVIFGNPDNYVARGFVSCKKNICVGASEFPAAMLVKELIPDALDGRLWHYSDSDIGSCCADEAACNAFDALFPAKEKKWMPSQEEFFIHCNSILRNS